MNEEMGARLNSILSDPQQMEKIRAMAQSLMGGAQTGEEAPPETPPPSGALAALLGSAAKSRGSDSEQLLRAMQPYMRPKRRTKIERALKITRLLGLAETMLEQYGGELDGL